MTKPFPDDMCIVCEQEKGPNARQTAPRRFQQWIDGLRSLGLTDEEISRIKALKTKVETRGKTAAEIREQLARGQA
ncbi:hypothetical protein IFU04_26180 [Pseudomonas syringae]|nr:hypothetical protein [Pseudomonas syringae]